MSDPSDDPWPETWTPGKFRESSGPCVSWGSAIRAKELDPLGDANPPGPAPWRGS